MFFKNKKKHKKEDLIHKLHLREFSYITCRNATNYTESIVGKDGVINLVEDRLVLLCGNKEVFNQPTSSVLVAELMSLDGFTIKQVDLDSADTYIVYYKYHRK